MLNQIVKETAKHVGKSLLRGTGRVVTGVLIFGVGSAIATALKPIAEKEGKKLYKSVYGEEPQQTRRTTQPKR